MAASFYNAMSANGIDVLEIIFPTVSQSNNYDGVPGVEVEAERIKSSGVRVIVSFLSGNTLFFAIHEAIRWEKCHVMILWRSCDLLSTQTGVCL